MQLKTKIAYNTIIQVASKFLSTILGLITIAMITRYLGQDGFGEYTTIITFISFFAVVADLGLTLISTQMISIPGADENKILSNLFSLRFVTALIFIGSAPFIVLFFPYSATIKIGVLLVSMSFIFPALNQILVGLFQKKLRMDKVSIAEIVSRLILVLGTYYAIKYSHGLYGILVAMVISSLINFIFHYLFSLKFAKVTFLFDFSLWHEIFKKCWPLAITIVFNLIYLRADTLILSLIKSQSDVGIYGAAYRVIDVLITIPFMFAGILLPVMTLSWAEKNLDAFKKILQKSFNVMSITIIPIVIGAQFIGKEIMIFVAGDKFFQSGAVLMILILAAGIIFISTVFSHAIIAIEKQKKIIWAYVFTSFTALIGYLIFIPKYSYFGAAWITIYSELFIGLTSYLLVWKYTKFVPDIKVFLKSVLASIAMSIFLYFFTNIFNLYIILFFSIIIYILSLYILKGITKEDIYDLLNKSYE